MSVCASVHSMSPVTSLVTQPTLRPLSAHHPRVATPSELGKLCLPSLGCSVPRSAPLCRLGGGVRGVHARRRLPKWRDHHWCSKRLRGTKRLWCPKTGATHWRLQSVSGAKAGSGWRSVFVVCLEPLEQLVKSFKHLSSEPVPLRCDSKVFPQWFPRRLVRKNKLATKLLAWAEKVWDFSRVRLLLFCQ